jgi:hypothetical protein
MVQLHYVITGGTLIHVAPHFAVCAPAYGQVGGQVSEGLKRILRQNARVVLVRTRMALGDQEPSAEERALFQAAGIRHLETNQDLAALVDHLIANPETRCIVMAAAVCDWEPRALSQNEETVAGEFGRQLPRLSTREGNVTLTLAPAEKILRRIRKQRKDIFLVGFKATAGRTPEECYALGLELLKTASANLVFANDVQTHQNVVITPEEFPYFEKNRKQAVRTLCEMIRDRTQLSFVRTELREGPLANLAELDERGALPKNFVPVLRFLLQAGAYKLFRGRTTGHFGCKVLDPSVGFPRISSLRKVDHNQVFQRGMAPIFGYDAASGNIVAAGAKPSVGEHTQHRIYQELGDRAHSIVHFHSPLSEAAERANTIPRAAQRPFECGSVECAENTATHMREVAPGIFAVQLDGHGPNIAFHRDVEPEVVIRFLKEHFALEEKTGGIPPETFRAA